MRIPNEDSMIKYRVKTTFKHKTCPTFLAILKRYQYLKKIEGTNS